MAVALTASDLTVMWVNPAAGEVLGWPGDDIVGRNAAEFIHPDDLMNLLPIVGEMTDEAEAADGPLTASAPAELPCRMLRADGTWSPMVVTGRILDAEGTMLAVVRPSAERHAFAEVLDGLGTGAPLAQILHGLVQLMQAQFGARAAWIVHDSDGQAEVIAAGDSESGGGESPIPFDPAKVLARLRAVAQDDWFVLVDGDLWLMPVQSGEADTVFAAFVLTAIRPEGPSPWDELLAHRTANLTGLAFARELRDRMLTLAATTDHLTGVLNRGEFERFLRECRGTEFPVTLFFLDLDDFKEINDEFGHLAGDAVLANLARRLQGLVRSGDRIGRLGGDEFVISCPELDSAAVESTRTRIMSVVAEPVALDGTQVAVHASVGVAQAFHTEQLENLIQRADSDMFHRKREAKEAATDGDEHRDSTTVRPGRRRRDELGRT